tara:strand:- start:203 stop:499 length:297 start_codon:yes stop_codon:yes gene_type:complete
MKLEPIEFPESMKITPEKECFFYLLNAGFTEKEVRYIKNNSEKEGVKFCIKTFSQEDLNEVKIELREYLRKNDIIKYEEKFYIYILKRLLDIIINCFY